MVQAAGRRRGALLRGALAACCAALALAPLAAAQGAGEIEDLWRQGEEAYRRGDLEAAEKPFREALARDEMRARSWNYLGGIHFSRGDLPEALRHFRRAFALDAEDVRICNNLATAYDRLGQTDRVEEHYLRATRLDPTYPPPWRNLGVLALVRRRDPEAARRAWIRYLELVPEGREADEVRSQLDRLPAASADQPAAPAPPPN